MILHQFYLGCLAHASYLIGDPLTGTAWVVDPQRDVEPYLAFAQEHGLRITDVVLTHLHADFVAGHLELRDRVGARVHLGAGAQVGYPVVVARDGDEHRFGDVRLRVLATPGHTPEGISLLVYDAGRDPAVPYAVLTGDTLFIGDVGRPDLLASAGMSAADLAGMLHHSIARLLELPDATLVYPAHGAGSLCGRNLSKQTVSTIGEQRRSNYALQPMTREAFIAQVTADQPPAPAYFGHDVALNRAGPQTGPIALADLDVAAVAAQVAAGAQVLDVRDSTAFAASHWRGSLNAGLDGQFATWAGAILDPSRPVVLIGDGREAEAALRLRRVGIDRIAGRLTGGMAALAAHPERVAQIARYTADALRTRLGEADPPLIVDVRNPGEREKGVIDGSMSIPLAELPRRLGDLPMGREIIVHCAGGYRSMVAASILAAAGRRTADLLGGYGAWRGATGTACQIQSTPA